MQLHYSYTYTIILWLYLGNYIIVILMQLYYNYTYAIIV